MNKKQIIKFGRILKLLRMDIIPKIYEPKNNIRIALTHYVKPADMDNFNSIISYLNNVRRIISPDEFFQYYISGSDNSIYGKLLLMTFDDGLYSSYGAAQTVLCKYGIKAIFFIPTQIFELENKEQMKKFAYKNLYHQERPLESLTEAEYVTMKKEHILQLRKQGHWILPHTHSHCNISDITTEDLVYSELIKPKLILEEFLKERIEGFAFPEGTEKTINAFSYRHIMEIYKFCFCNLTGVNHSKTNHHYFHRDCLHDHYPLFHVKDIMDGVFDLYYLIKMKRLQSIVKGYKRRC